MKILIGNNLANELRKITDENKSKGEEISPYLYKMMVNAAKQGESMLVAKLKNNDIKALEANGFEVYPYDCDYSTNTRYIILW